MCNLSQGDSHAGESGLLLLVLRTQHNRKEEKQNVKRHPSTLHSTSYISTTTANIYL
nr:MAG TPA: hypothetical protein [Caudoviricetes sp.]